MILFGSTAFTAKECYQIIFPVVHENLLPTLVNETSTVNTILLNLITHDDLKPSDKIMLPTTNVFVLFHSSCSKAICEHPDFSELRNFRLSRSCRKYFIHFRDSSDFNIFEDFQELSISDKPSKDYVEPETDGDVWYQSKTFVKGFKDILVNNKSIWN